MPQVLQTFTKRALFSLPCCLLVLFGWFGILLFSGDNASAEEVPLPILKIARGDQPEATIAVEGARGIIFTRVNLTAVNGDVRIESMTIMRTGQGSDGVFSSVGIEDVGDSGDLNANHQYKVKAPFTIPEGETIEIELKGNMKSNMNAYNYERPTISLVAVDTKAKIEGELPITGTAHTINSGLTVGSLSIKQGGLDPRANADIATLEKDVIFNSIRVTAGNVEDIRLKNIYWIPVGSAGDDDVINPKAVINYRGEISEFPANVYYDGDGVKKYRVKVDLRVTLPKGESAEIYLKGDIGHGINRTVRMDPEKLNGIGVTYGYEVRDTTSRAGVTFTIVPSLFRISTFNAYEQFQGETRLGDITLEVKGEVASIKSLELKTDDPNAQRVKLWTEQGELAVGPGNSEGGRLVLAPPVGRILELPTGRTKFIVTGQTQTGFAVSSLSAEGKISGLPLNITGLPKN